MSTIAENLEQSSENELKGAATTTIIQYSIIIQHYNNNHDVSFAMADNSAEATSAGKETFVCIECGSFAESLFIQYAAGTIKLKQCLTCQGIVDKYVEYDNVLVLLDTLLHKSQAFRHVLFNIDVKVTRQLLVLCILCDTYMRWITFRQMYFSEPPSSQDWHLVLEVQFYVMLAISCLELLVNVLVTSLVVKFAQSKKNSTEMSSCGSFQSLFRILILSSYGKLLAVAALIWGQENSHWCLWLTKLFVMTSNAEAIKVITKGRFGEAFGYVICGVLAGYLLQDYALWVIFANPT